MVLIKNRGYFSSKSLLHTLSFVFIYLIVISFNNPTNSGAVELDPTNFDSTLASTELVFINFYADWCRFSNLLAPIFNEAADKIKEVFPDANQVVLARVDSDKHSTISSRYKVSKYPTLKLIRNGIPVKKEYRGARSSEAFLEYIKKQLENPMHEFTSMQELMKIEDNKRIFIGYMRNNASASFLNFRRVAMSLKDDCTFYIGFGDATRSMHPPEQDIIAFRPDKTRSVENDETYTGNYENFDELHAWIQGKCVAAVREITFENAEELTEEGLPFLILFHHPDDTESVKAYNALVLTFLSQEEKQTVNFVTADGIKFAHPLHHLGKSDKDLPLIAIDSFRHMYLYPNAADMHRQPNKIKEFISDLHSGKLHREFHYGADPADENKDKSQDSDGNGEIPTSPPESTFRKLLPSSNRYSLLKDEL